MLVMETLKSKISDFLNINMCFFSELYGINFLLFMRCFLKFHNFKTHLLKRKKKNSSFEKSSTHCASFRNLNRKYTMGPNDFFWNFTWYVLSKLYQSISKSFEIIGEKSTNLIQILQNWEKNLDDWNTTWTMFWSHGVIYSLQNDLTWSHLLHHTYLYTIRKSLQNNLDFTHKIAY